jgi:hypothetical protein
MPVLTQASQAILAKNRIFDKAPSHFANPTQVFCQLLFLTFHNCSWLDAKDIAHINYGALLNKSSLTARR